MLYCICCIYVLEYIWMCVRAYACPCACVWVGGCVKSGSVSATEIHPATLHVSPSSPWWCQSSPLLHISESWHMPRCPLSPSLFCLCLTLSIFLAIVILFLCHSSSLPILTSSFLPDYISGDFDSITAEVKAFFLDKVSETQLTHSELQVYTEKHTQIKSKGQTSF